MVHLISVISICLQAFVGVPGCPHKAQTGGLCNGTLSWNKTIRSFCLVCSFYKMIPYWTFWNVTRYFLLHYWKNEDDLSGEKRDSCSSKRRAISLYCPMLEFPVYACLQLLQDRYNSAYRNPWNTEFFSFGISASHAHFDLLKTRSSKAIWNHNLLVEQSSDFKSLAVFAHPTLFWGSLRTLQTWTYFMFFNLLC